MPKGLFKACIVPRPIAWIGTSDKNGNSNLAPFSYFNAIADEPPMVMFSTTNQHVEGGVKDTPKNIELTMEFSINVVPFQLAEKMNLTSGDLARKESEFSFAQVDIESCQIISSPRVKGSPVTIECQHYRTIQLPKLNDDTVNQLVIGKVVGIYVSPDCLTKNGTVDIYKIKPVARLGYNDYAVIDSIFSMVRPEIES